MLYFPLIWFVESIFLGGSGVCSVVREVFGHQMCTVCLPLFLVCGQTSKEMGGLCSYGSSRG